jgi:hypothetical protein
VSGTALQTKRLVLGQIAMCRGCCCGNVERGKPDVPVDWLKAKWKDRGLRTHIQLTFSGCLGPCDVSNVVTVASGAGSTWLGGIQHRRQYESLVDWASRSVISGELLALPEEFAACRIEPFRLAEMRS